MTSSNKVAIHPDDNWAQVELFRWQYGVLPRSDDYRKLNHAEALDKMTDALESGIKSGDMSKAPAPHNVISVMRYFARRESGRARR